MRLKQCIFALMAMLLCAFSANAQGGSVAKIGSTEYTTFADAMAAANATTGNVDVEVYGAVEFVDGMELNGSYTAITFTGKSEEAKITINQTAGGDYLTAHGKTVAFNDLILAKANPAWIGNSGHMGNYFSIQGGTVTYTDCTFPNGACTNTGTAVYNNCTFQNSSEYGLWVYDDALVTVNGGTIDSKKGIKVYSEGEQDVTSTLTVQNATFTENVTAKPAVAVGYAQSITLIGNTYNNPTAHVELDSGSDADCEGITFVAQDSEGNDIASTLKMTDRSNSSAPCGVLVGDKIYTTVTEAAAEATEGSTVTLLYDSTEEVELPEGVTLNKNGYTADDVTVATSGVAQVGENVFTTVLEALQYAIDNNAAELKILCDVREKMTTDCYLKINADLTITADAPVKVEFYNDGTTYDFVVGSTNNNTLTIGENVHFDLVDRVIWLGYWGNDVTVVVNGYLGGYQIWHGANTVVNGTLDSHGEAFVMRRDATLTANEGAKVNANYFQIYSGHIVAENATITAGLVWVNNNHNNGIEGTVSFKLDNTEFTSNGEVKIYAGEGKTVSVTLENSSSFDAKGVVTLGDNVKVVADATSSIQDANGPVVIPVAKIGSTTYATLAEAAAAAQAGNEIELLADATVEGTLALPAGIKLTSNGHTINGSIRMLGDLELNGPLTITGGLWVGKSGETLTATLSGDKLTASYFMFQRGTYTINADIDAVYGYLSYEGTFEVNSTIHTTGANGEVLYINGNVTLNDGAVLDSDNSVFVCNDNAVLTLKPGSKVDSNLKITTSGAEVYIDATGMTAGASANITGTVNNSGNGTIAVVGNDKLKAQIVDGKIVLVLPAVAKVGDVEYATLAEAVAAATEGATITMLGDAAEDVTLPAGVKFNGNYKAVGNLTAGGEITFTGITKAVSFSVQYTNTTVNIVPGACLEITGSGRMVIGHGCTFNITGTITDAKTADKATLVPSLKIAAGASITGNGVTFNVNNAYIVANANTTSKNSNASGTLDFNIENSIWEQTGVLAFYVPTSGKDPVVNFELKNSVLTTTSHLVFSVTKGEIVFDNSLVNQGTSRQLENRSTMTIKNGSVVNGAVATSSNAKNPGTLIVEDATYAVTGEFSGSDLGIGTLIVKKGATVSAGSITKANIQIDATGMAAGDEINLTANLSNLAGTIEVVNNNLDAQIVDGKIVLSSKSLSGEGTAENPYLIETLKDLKFFRDDVNAGNTYAGKTVKVINNIDLNSEAWTPIATFNGVFDGNDKTISNLVVNGDGKSNQGFFGQTNNGEIKNLTINNATVRGRLNVGVVAGTPYTSKYTNIKVTGDVVVEGMAYVGGVGGKNAYANWTDVTVDVNAGSYVKATSTEDGTAYRTYVGGVVGFNGEGGHTFKNISSNIKVIGDVIDIGGIFGIAHYGNKFENVTFSGSVEAAEGAKEVGGIAGVWNNTAGYTVTFTNCAVADGATVMIGTEDVTEKCAIVGGAYKPSNNTAANSGSLIIDGKEAWIMVAQVGETKYADLQEAIKAAAPAGTVELLSDVTVDEWIMFSETLTIGNGDIITTQINGLTINGNGKTVTIKDIESAGNGARLFYDATNLNINNLTFNFVDNAANLGGIGLTAGTINNVTFNGGGYAIFPGTGAVIIEGCTFKTNATSIYYEEERDNLVVTGNTFENPDNVNVILLRGNTTFTDNNVISGRTVNVVSGSPVVTGNNFNDVRFKVYNVATATIEDNTINTLAFNDESVVNSTFDSNTLSAEAQAVLDAAEFPVAGLLGEGTETSPYLISNKKELLWFQAKVDEQAADGSTQFAGKYFKLTADIDLAGENWNPIGSMIGDHGSFKGVFDGGDHTISNLKVEQAGNGIGLFARTAGNAVIKNLKLKNVSVKSTDNSNYAGAVVGNAYASTKIENVHVSGNVLVSGRGYIGGIAGHGYVVMDNVSVVATGDGQGNDKGLITSTFWCAGGILGYGGEGSTNIMNANVENVVVTSAAGGLGAIVGMAEDNKGTQPISGSNLSAKDVEIKTYTGAYGDAYANYGLGYLYGGNPTSKLTGENSVENVTITTSNGVAPTPVDAVAKVNDAIYFSLQAALDAAAAGTGNVTVTILADVNLTGIDWNPVTVSATGYPVVTVEGGNHTITGLNDMLFHSTWAGNSGLIIKDLTIANSAIVNDKDDAAGTVGVGAFIGYPQASATITLDNCHLKNSSVEGGHWTGGLIGMAGGYNGEDGPVFMNLTIKGCSVTGSTITGKGSVGGVIGHGSCSAWTNVVIEETTVEGNTITSTGSSNVKAGAIMGTIGAAGQPTTANGVTKTGGASVSATVAGNTVTSNGTEITTIYGRQGTATGQLYVAGGSYDNYPIEQGVAYAAPIEGYEIVQNTDGTYGIQEAAPAYVAQVGDAQFETLSEAVAAAQAGETVTLLADVETADGIVITDKNLVIDLNDKTYTTTEGASTNNRNFKIEGTSVVTIKNGTMVAAGNYSSGAYGTVRTEGNANVTLEGLKLYNYRGNGLNIKACGSSVVTINNTEIYSNYGGGIESAGGTIEIANVKVEQKGMYTNPWNSMAISVNSGGKVTVNSGTFSTECITAEEANNQGTSHGPWVAGVLNSGGTLIINGGTFSNDNFGENSLATYARGAILADTKAKVEINGGKFNVLNKVIDIQNNLGDANNNPSVVLAGGTYSADPRESAQYGSNLITLADGYTVVENGDGTYGIVEAPKAPEVVDGKIEFIDGEFDMYTNDTDIENVEITYKRTLRTSWVALYVPFEIPMSMLLENFEVAYFNDVHSYDDDHNGTIDRMSMELVDITNSNATLRANYPYFIRAKSAENTVLDITLEDATLYADDENSIDCTSMYHKFEITGTHKRMTSDELGDSRVVSTEGEWVYQSSTGTLKPFRFYLTITNRNGSPVEISENAQMSVVVRDEDGTTGIDGIYGDENGETVIFDLYGRRVLEPEKGNIYIINGKKVLVK